tara:strand:- start:376 stop:693 length:318 start_codon:yes stop_codon:yes gene_type:complete
MMNVGNGGYTQAADDAGPNAGYDKKLFKGDDDLLSQDYQTPGESGQAKWRFSNIYPVLKLSLSNSQGDGPSIDDMVDASKMFVNRMDESSKKKFKDFMIETQFRK